jgi:hypothetical protein
VKIFLAWSGKASRALGVALRGWLPDVLQTVSTFLSDEDIDKGARWVGEIARELDESSFGVLCVTRENVGSNWLNFEAGALSKAFGTTTRVAPVLVDLRPADVTGPLAMFQAVELTEQDVKRLVRTINAACPEPLDDARLATSFAQWWPRLYELIGDVRELTPDPPLDQRETGEMVEEVLAIVRGLQRDARDRAQVDPERVETSNLLRRLSVAVDRQRYREGMRIHNPKYGEGIIVKSTITKQGGEEVVVKFDGADGVRIFAAGHATLTPIDPPAASATETIIEE